MGLLYFNARYYDPTLGRFLTEDPSRKRHSWYSYCGNNPLAFTDPTGRREIVNEDRSGRPVYGDARAGWRGYAGRTDVNKPTPVESRPAYPSRFVPVTWEASFVEFGYGFLAAGAPVLEGIGVQQGIAFVHFANAATGEYFEAAYALNLTGVQGVAATVGDIVDFGVVTGRFPASTPQGEIARAFAGDFFVGTLSLPVGPVLGISGSAITSDKWKGFSLGGSLGWGAGFSTQVVNYTLMKESMTPLTTPPMPTYMSPEEAQRIINAFQGH